MKIKSFFKLVEIATKTASQFPLIFGTLYSWIHFRQFNPEAFVLMFLSLLFFDMTTTTINNYMDYRKAKDREYRESHNIIGIDRIPENQVIFSIFFMFTIAVAAGILLVWLTGPVVLILGALSFFTGIFYTFGPIPISRMPLGEILSGFFMGFVITYLSIYIHNTGIGEISFSGADFILRLDIKETLFILTASLPFVFGISNLMLANNICDIRQDIKNDRFLLPYYLGKGKSLIIFRLSYYAGYLAIPATVLIGALPPMFLVSLLTFPLINRNIKIFHERQIKTETFITAVKNLTIISLGCIISLIIEIVIGRF